MPTIEYSAIDSKTGRECSGFLESIALERAEGELKSRGLHPTSLALADGTRRVPRMEALLGGASKPGSRELTVFMRQLSTLLNAGVPLARALELLKRQTKRGGLIPIIETLMGVVGGGGRLSEGMSGCPRVFDTLCVSMVRAGEACGSLGDVLARLSVMREKVERVKSRMISAMIYPAIIMSVATLIVGALMVFVVPRFESVFLGILKGQPMPVPTQIVMAVSRGLSEHAVLIAVGILLACAALKAVVSTKGGAHAKDMLMLRLPLFGSLQRKAAAARFCRTLGALLNGGVPILEALEITSATCGNVAVARAIVAVSERVKHGEGISGPLEDARIFPELVPGMVRVGEETGALPEMLGRVADAYDIEVDDAVAGFTAVIEPVMIVIMALVVGVIVIALFLPIMRIVQGLSG